MSVDRDLLADYVGGALEGTQEQERVAGLIATSPEWCRAAEELAAALHGVQLDLNVLRETPEPMPQDVAARLEALFEGPRRDPLEPRVVTPRAKRSSRPKAWKRWVAPIAVVAAAFGVYALGQVPGVMAPMLDGSADGLPNSYSAEAGPAAAPAPQAVPTVKTGAAYDRTNVDKTLALSTGTLDRADTRDPAKTWDNSAPVPSALQRLSDQAALQQCLNAVTAVSPGRVDLVEYAYFEGSPALVITITSNNGQRRFVAGADCGQRGPDEKFQTPPK